jgi:ATP-dependent Clp protease, protease subunit
MMWNLAMDAFLVGGSILSGSPSAEPLVGAGRVRYRAPMSIGTFTEAFDRPIDPVDRLLRRRVIMLSGPIDTERANDVMARLLYLEGEDPEAPIDLRINSPGGEVLSGLAIVDTIAQLACPVATTCAGMAASMASVLLASGTKGRRRATANARVLIHQPWAGQFQGQATDLERAAEEILRQRARIDQLLADATGQPVERIHRDTERDTWFSAQEALDYGLVDEVVGS